MALTEEELEEQERIRQAEIEAAFYEATLPAEPVYVDPKTEPVIGAVGLEILGAGGVLILQNEAGQRYGITVSTEGALVVATVGDDILPGGGEADPVVIPD